jgi:MFS family permease
MSVVTCPLCSTRVNAGAARCPECGADICLDREQALLEVFTRDGTVSCPLSARPVPKSGWSWSWRILAAIPALIAPSWVIARAAQEYVEEARWYYSLPMHERLADGDPFSASSGMDLAGFAIAAGLMLALISLSVALPRRLWLWWGLVVSLLALGLAWLFVSSGAPVGLGFLYLPVLVALRTWWQRRADSEHLVAPGHLAEPRPG